jgi:Na+-translocating ferredoxin:NAD+ oxidoreductase RNF subunit RnfB
MNRKAVFVIVIALSIATFAATIVVSYAAIKVEKQQNPTNGVIPNSILN